MRGCHFVTTSFLEGASFLHVAPGAPSGVGPAPTIALRVLPDGNVDRASSAVGIAVHGRFPGAAWLRVDAPEGIRLSRWQGDRWGASGPPSEKAVFWAQWRDGGLLRMVPQLEGGIALTLEGTDTLPPGFEVPRELDDVKVSQFASLPEQGVIVFTGTYRHQPGQHVIVAGAQRASFGSRAGPAIFALSPRADRLLLGHRVSAPDGEIYQRAVRVVGGRVVGGERLPDDGELAIDERGGEWLFTAEGALFRHELGAPRWELVAEVFSEEGLVSFDLQPFGDEVWLSRGDGLFRFVRGELERVALPPGLAPGTRTFAMQADREGRLWVNTFLESGGPPDVLTTGPVPRELRCEEVLPGPGPAPPG